MKLLAPGPNKYNKFKSDLINKLEELEKKDKNTSVKMVFTEQKLYDQALMIILMKMFVIGTNIKKGKSMDNISDIVIDAIAKYKYISISFSKENKIELLKQFFNMMNNVFTSELVNEIKEENFFINFQKQATRNIKEIKNNITDNLIHSAKGKETIDLILVSLACYAIFSNPKNKKDEISN